MSFSLSRSRNAAASRPMVGIGGAPGAGLLNWLLFAAGTAAAEAPLTLEQALAEAERDAPRIEAGDAAARAAQSLVAPAGELPDPQLLFGIDNLPIDGPDAGSFTADFMTMRRIGVMQEFPNRAKRAARTERAVAEVEREQALLTVATLTVRESVAMAWIAVHRTERTVELLEALKPRLDAQVMAADAALAGGRGSTADAILARSQRSALEDRLAEARRDAIKARADLARWLPEDAQRPLAEPPDFRVLDRDPAAIVAGVARHRGLLAIDAQQRVVQAELSVAQAEKRPDWALEVSYGDRGPAFSNMVSAGVRIDLPIFGTRRQDPVVASKRAALERVEAEREDARREHVAELRGAIAIWESERERVALFERELLPLAADRADAAIAAYRGGRGDLAGSLIALNDLIEQQLAATQRRAELAEAWVTLRYAFAQER